MKENVVMMKRIPNTNWSICLTNLNHEFFYNSAEQDKNTWEIPDEILDIVGGLLNDAMNSDDEMDPLDGQDNNNVDGANGVDNSIADDSVEIEPIEEREQDNIETVQEIELPASKRIKIETVPIVKRILKEKKCDFFNILAEYGISPFSTWDIIRDKKMNDQRLNDIPLDERRIFFEEWSALKSSEALSKKAKEAELTPETKYQALLQEKVTFKSGIRFEDFCRRCKRDARYINLANTTTRKSIFDQHVQTLMEEERKNARVEFQKLLEDQDWIKSDTSASFVHEKLSKAQRYIALKNSKERNEKILAFISAKKN